MVKYNAKKKNNQEVVPMIEKHLTEKGLTRFNCCGNWIDFFADLDLTKFKVFSAEFCKNRFCPVCMWRLAHKDALKISVLMDYLEQEHNRAFMFATFTAPNVKGDKLKNEITKYNKAFKNLLQTDEVEKMNDGFIRKLEVTYNGDPEITQEYYIKAKDYCEKRNLKPGDANPNYDTYHTHFHCIFSVTKGYFSGGRYIKQERWLQLWRDVMKDQTITQVDVRRVKRQDKNKVSGENDLKGTAKVPDSASFDKAVLEIAKYAAKDIDFIHSSEVFDVFYTSLFRRQVLTYGGSFAKANKKYKQKELEHYKTVDGTEYVWRVMYEFAGEYREKRKKAMSKEMYEFLKKTAEDESPM